jgi:hypothetical protein
MKKNRKERVKEESCAKKVFERREINCLYTFFSPAHILCFSHFMVLFVRPSVCPVVARVLDRKVLLVRLAA